MPPQARGEECGGALVPLDPDLVRRLAAAALAEDVGTGDVTTAAVVPAGASAKARIVAREPLVICGLDLAREVFRQVDAELVWVHGLRDGDRAAPGAMLAGLQGRAASILTGERCALNFLQRLSGIATLTRAAVDEVAGTKAAILDTRKTTPTLRAIEKYAVRSGGGINHRWGLCDAVLIKDNHIAVAGGITQAVRRVREAGRDPASIELEVDDLDGVRAALDAGVGRILLDNFEVADVARAAALIGERAKIEVSGGLRPGRLRAYAEAGADLLSIGRLTHSAPAVDVALDIDAGDNDSGGPA